MVGTSGLLRTCRLRAPQPALIACLAAFLVPAFSVPPCRPTDSRAASAIRTGQFATIQQAQALLQIGKFDHAAGAVRLCSLELGAPFGAAETANEGSWQITPFTGEGVNDNAPMRVGTDPENYQTTGGYALYPGRLPSCAQNGGQAPCA